LSALVPAAFTGIRVGIAAAHGLAIGWNAKLTGMSSLGLLAAGATHDGDIAVAVSGGHRELFVQQFHGVTHEPVSDVFNLPPAQAAASITARVVVGSGARTLVDARGWGEVEDRPPSAADALKLPLQLRSLAAKPIYARAPDAQPRQAA
jgi:tRNA threonylcarbamoyladenosine biosynthesis protein TsaB